MGRDVHRHVSVPTVVDVGVLFFAHAALIADFFYDGTFLRPVLFLRVSRWFMGRDVHRHGGVPTVVDEGVLFCSCALIADFFMTGRFCVPFCCRALTVDFWDGTFTGTGRAYRGG